MDAKIMPGEEKIKESVLNGYIHLIHDSETVKERVRWAINYISENHGMSNEKLANIIGCATSTINSYRRKITMPGLEFFALFIYKYNFNMEWFVFGRGEPFPGARDKYHDVCGPEDGSYRVVPVDSDFPPDDFVFISQVKGKISAGGGLAPDNDVNMQLAFRSDWIKKKGSPGNMSLIKVSGDSMEPTLLSGDLVLIDHSRISVAPQGGIYAVAIDHEIMIKRIQVLFPTNKLKIISDNKRYEPIEADPEQVKINGKVIWYARDLER